MVFIVVKKSEEDQFLFETNCNALGEDVIVQLTYLHNLRLKISRLIGELENVQKSHTKPGKDEEDSSTEPLSLPGSIVDTIQRVITNARIYLSKVKFF